MATIETTYVGGFRTEGTHLQSGSKIITDAPTDNNGKGEAFSPTDLLAAALTTCMLTIIAMRTERYGINIEGATCQTTKVMAVNPRRVSEITIKLKFPFEYSDEQKRQIEDAALTCPVYYSLSENLVKTIDFGW